METDITTPSDPLIINFIKMFQQDEIGYRILISSVVVKIFYGLYNRLVIVDVKPIEMLPNTEKNKYWEIAKKYYPDQENAIKASKAAYILALITSN